MKPLLLVLQIATGIGLIAVILLQTSKGGLGTAFGGSGEFRSKRGAEILVFRSTIILAVLFFAICIANIFIS